MAKAELKTRENDSSVHEFLAAVPNEKRRKDAQVLLELMQEVTGLEPRMWGPSIVGFGSYRYKYASGHEGDSPLIAFSPRKQALTLYISADSERQAALMRKLGKYKTSKVCLYLNKLDDVDLPTLRELVRESFERVRETSRCDPCEGGVSA